MKKRLTSYLGLENESELEELLKLQKEQENGDMFDETYMKLKEDQLVETKKDRDKKAKEEGSKDSSSGGEENKDENKSEDSDSSGDTGGDPNDLKMGDGSTDTSSDSDSSSSDSSSSGGDSSSGSDSSSDDALAGFKDLDKEMSEDKKDDDKKEDDKKDEDDALAGFKDLDKEMSEDKDKEKEEKEKEKEEADKKKEEEKAEKEKEKEEKDAAKDLESMGALKMPSTESYYIKYRDEYKPLRIRDEKLSARVISVESLDFCNTFNSRESYIDKVSIEELIDIHNRAMAKAAAQSLCIGDILTLLGGHNRYSFEDFVSVDMQHYDDWTFTHAAKGMLSKAGEYIGDKVEKVTDAAGNKMAEGFNYVKDLGFKYGEVAVRHVGKAVMSILDNTLKGLHAGTQALIKYIKDRPEQYKSNRALLTKAGELAKEVKNKIDGKKLEDPKPYENDKIINSIKINGKFLPMDNSRIAFEAVKNYYETFIEHVTESTRSITNLIQKAKSPGAKTPEIGSAIKIPIFNNYIKKEPEGYNTPEGMTTMIYKETVPGDILFIVRIPEEVSEDNPSDKLDQLEEIYNQTSLFLGINKSTYEKKASGTYFKTIDELIEYIEFMKEVTDYCIKAQDKLEQYNKLRDNIKEELKDYTGSLFKSKEEINVQNSLIEYFTPNLTMLDNLSTKGTYVIDSYMKKFISSTIEFINDCLKDGFSIAEGESSSSSSSDSSDTSSSDSGSDTSSSDNENKEEENKPEGEENKEESGNEEEKKDEENKEST